MINDIIEILKNRFNDFGLHMCKAHTDNCYTYFVRYDNRQAGLIVFYDDNISYMCNVLGRERPKDKPKLVYSHVNYSDLDADVLVGLFLCEAIYG